ncbi:acyl-CoA thioesterase II [Pseudofrankia asymbiotica]|uniref:Acyl-CoA thioesterase II n=2 Tax=Pseudofrankia asymbiotica TaxID=1834516 RepID=A0A1V2IHJ3_9ACTN|nr:acyl-CoA thioesterase domain-containing protein [Pseudofrankia asymbiotica]ONH32648.1 acyl-CoA thioesterase II [Pseudofrankia asymbiotica]
MIDLDPVLDTLALERVADDRYRAGNLPFSTGVVFGGQILAQAIVAALVGQDGKSVKTIHTVFARGGVPDKPMEIDVDRMHGGRTFSSSTVTFSQDGKVRSRSMVLLSAEEPDLIRHADTPTPALSPAPIDKAVRRLQSVIVGDVDLNTPDLVGPPDLDVWSRWADAPGDPATSQALIAFASESFLIGTAMRPHEGVGQSLGHVTLSTGVISHTVTFHQPCDAGSWLLSRLHSSYAGGGRAYGHGDVFTEDGRLIASLVQDSMIRPMAPAPDGSRPKL